MTVEGLGGAFFRALDGLRVSSSGINTSSNNIANVNTEGYNRQIFVQGTRASQNGGFVGGGVVDLGITSLINPFIERQLANETSEFGTFDGRRLTTSAVENILYESTDEGIGGAINKFFNAWSELKSNPSDRALRLNLRENARLLTDRFQNTHQQLSDLRSDLSATVQSRLSKVNDQLSQIAELNGSIKNTTSDYVKEELKAQRNLLVRKLSEEVGVNYFENQDETFTIQLQGTGLTLVRNTSAATLSATDDLGEDGQMTINSTIAGAGAATVDVTSLVTSGRLGGNLIDRNTTLNTRLSELNTLAYQLATDVNTLHYDGFGLDGVDQRNFFAPLGSATNAAANIGLDSAIENSVDAIAAALEDPAISGVGDARQAELILNLRNSLALDGGTRTYSQYYSSMVSSSGIDAGNVQSNYEAKGNLLNKLQQQRENISGVNIDEEAADLIKYQRAFEGAARVMTIADEMLRTILDI